MELHEERRARGEGESALSDRVLVTGASIAGNALAWWLGRHGFAVTVVERAPRFREGGQNVDVRGIGRDVIRRMGLEQAALDLGTGEEGTVFVDGHGRPVATFRVGDGGGPTAEMEILRGDLARLLHEAVPDETAYRFGDSIAAVTEDSEAATVTFASGRVERYAIVVIAEGVGSATRGLVFPGENQPRWMNLTSAFLTIPRVSGDDRMWRWFHAGKGRGVSLRPDAHGTTRAFLTSQGPPAGEQDWNVPRQKQWLRARFADAGWETPRVLASLDETDDFYFDVLRQVRMDRWSNGRVVLAGDAAWCVTPLGGRGTTLAIVGAYVLAGELARAGIAEFRAAFAAYERTMRPLVAGGQRVPTWVPRLFHPRTRVGVRLLHGSLRTLSRRGVQRVIGRMSGGRRPEPDLPRYGETGR